MRDKEKFRTPQNHSTQVSRGRTGGRAGERRHRGRAREDEEEASERRRTVEWEQKKQEKGEGVKDVGGCENETMRELRRAAL